MYIKELLKSTSTREELGKLKDYEFTKNKATKNYTNPYLNNTLIGTLISP